MSYPTGFPVESQAEVEDAKILADEAFDQARKQITVVNPVAEGQISKLIRDWIVRVALVFALEACKLGDARTWTVTVIDEHVKEFMKRLATEAEDEKRFYANGTRFQGSRLTDPYRNGNIDLSVLHLLKSTEGWKQYQARLSAVAKKQRKSPQPHIAKSAAELKRLRTEAGLSQNELSKLAGITRKTVVRHENEQTGIRADNELAYERVLSAALKRPIKLRG